MTEQEQEQEYNPTVADVDPIPAENQVELTGGEDEAEEDGGLQEDEDV